jgi:hypothetical protein
LTTPRFQDECIHSKPANIFDNGGFVFCGLKEGYYDCKYVDMWNECPDFKPVRSVMRDMDIHYPPHIRRVK